MRFQSQLLFGTIDCQSLLESLNGSVEVTLIDSGIKRPMKGKYQWEEKQDFIVVGPFNEPEKAISIQKEIPITSDLLGFIGLYLGDGDKTGDIGFSQREINILKFAVDMQNKIFSSQFPMAFSILEDTKRFQNESLTQKLDSIKRELRNELPQPIENIEKKTQQEFLIREFLEKASSVSLAVERSSIGSPVISPKKGARAAGKSSLEYIQQLRGSAWLLPLWMKIVYETVDSVVKKKEVKGNWLRWETDKEYLLNVSSYLREEVSYFTGRKIARYEVEKENCRARIIYKTNRHKACINDPLKLSPLFFLVAGFYFAEGDTKKENIFLFDRQKVSLSVALTSSEERILDSFIKLLNLIGDDLLNKWKVKVGTKYFMELEEIAQKMGVITMRGGVKGQGYVRTLEIHEAMREWALSLFPCLAPYKTRYTNVEVTGVGIPRVHLMGNSTVDVYFFSLLKDAIFDTGKIIRHLE